MSSTQRQVSDVLSELARDNYRGLIDPHTYRLQRARLLDELVVDEDEEASSTTRPQGPARDRRAANPPLSDPANQRRRDVDRVREKIETAEVLQIVDAARRQAREAADAASAASEASVPRSGEAPQSAKGSARPAAGPSSASSSATTAPPGTAPSGKAPSAIGGSRKLVIAGIVAAIVVVGGGLAVVMSGGDSQPDPASDTRVAETPGTLGERLLGEFMSAGDWSDSAVTALSASWAQLLPSQRQQALDSAAYRSIAFEVRRRLLESAALRELEGGDSDSGQALVALAQAMDLPVPLPDDNDGLPVAGTAPVASAPGDEPDDEPDVEPGVAQQPVPESIPASAPKPAKRTKPEPAVDSGQDKAPALATSETPGAAGAGRAPTAVSAAAGSSSRGAPADSAPTAKANEGEEPAQVSRTAPTAPADSGCHAGLLNTRQRSCADALGVGGEGPRMAIIKPGSFTMGSKWAQEEGPPHSVTLDAPFGIAAFEVSHDEYQLYCSDAGTRCPANPWGAGDYPVVDVSWEEATAYARWLSAQTGRRYRLPTEAEWEFAARAGVDSRYPSGDELLPVHARYASGLGAEEPWPRSYRDAPRNGFGLYNSIGNVREWVADAWHDTHAGAPPDGSAREGAGARVVRGGSYADESTALRLSSRMRLDGAARNGKTGFRVVLDFRGIPD